MKVVIKLIKIFEWVFDRMNNFIKIIYVRFNKFNIDHL